MNSRNFKAVWMRNRKDLWLLRGIAAIISLLLWITVLGGKKVEITKKVLLDYQLPKNLTIANEAQREVNFRISGPRAFIRELEDRVLSVPIELSGAKVGDYEVIIREDMLDLPLGLKVVSVSQDSIQLKLDRVAIKRVPVRVVFSSPMPEGLKVISVTSKPSTVELKGPQQRLSTAEMVPTEPLSLSPNSLRQEFDTRLNLSDFPGTWVEESQKIVHVVAELEGSLSRKWVRKVNVGLKLKSGSSLKVIQNAANLGIRIRPSSVNFLLEGPDKMISELKAADVEVWAEIGELKSGTVKARLDWRLAPELRVVKRSSDWVDVVIPQLH